MKTRDELEAELEQLKADMAGYLSVVDDSRAVVAAFKKSMAAVEREMCERGAAEWEKTAKEWTREVTYAREKAMDVGFAALREKYRKKHVPDWENHCDVSAAGTYSGSI